VAGKYDPPALQARFLYPKARQSERSQIRATVTLPSGESVSGIVNAIDDFSIAIVDASGRYRSWLFDDTGIKVALEDPLELEPVPPAVGHGLGPNLGDPPGATPQVAPPLGRLEAGAFLDLVSFGGRGRVARLDHPPRRPRPRAHAARLEEAR
jgi:hypothetical protein